MNVKEIVAKYLKDNGFDGLAGDICGCFLKDRFSSGETSSDIMPCDGPCGECEPGYKHEVEEGDDYYCEGCEVDDWVITTKNPERKNNKKTVANMRSRNDHQKNAKTHKKSY